MGFFDLFKTPQQKNQAAQLFDVTVTVDGKNYVNGFGSQPKNPDFEARIKRHNDILIPFYNAQSKEYAYGEQRDYFEDINCVGWIREGDDLHKGCAVVISNKDTYNKPMEMGDKYAGNIFIDSLQRSQEKVIIDENDEKKETENKK